MKSEKISYVEPKEINLFFTQGSADKIYQIQLVEDIDICPYWLVNFQYGRRGKPLTSGTKTKTPIGYNTARKCYDKLVASKLAKGYTETTSGIAYTNTPNAGKRTTFLPQLLNEVTLTEAKLYYETHPHITALQIKHDGERRGVIITDNIVIPANRKGLITEMQEDVVKACATLGKVTNDLILDAEDMGDYLVIFDILQAGRMLREDSFLSRSVDLGLLQNIIANENLQDLLHVEIPTYPATLKQFLSFIKLAEIDGEEGVVIRNENAIYEPGRPNSGGDCLKLKFWATATVFVYSVHPTKRSVGITVLKDNQISYVAVGNCTIPGHTILEVGDLIEVKYLYYYPGGSLFEPSYKGLRIDKNIPDLLSSLKVKT